MGGSIRQTLPLTRSFWRSRLATLAVAGRSAIGCDRSLLDGEPLVARLLTRVTGGFLIGTVAGMLWGLWALPRGPRSIVGME